MTEVGLSDHELPYGLRKEKKNVFLCTLPSGILYRWGTNMDSKSWTAITNLDSVSISVNIIW